MAFDFFALIGVIYFGYVLRIGPAFAPTDIQWLLMLCAPILAIPVFLRMGLYRSVIRYLPERAMWTVLQAMLVATLLWVFLLFVAEAGRFAVLPRSLPVFYFLLGSIVVGGARFVAKLLLWNRPRQQRGGPVMLIYGADEGGRQLAQALRSQNTGIVAGFIDSDAALHGRDVMGLRVHPPDSIGSLIKDMGVTEVLLSLPAIPASRRQEIITDLSRLPVKIRSLPAISEIASGKYIVSQLREIDIDDLLGRSSVPADPDLLRPMIEDRVVMVTGAGGSIGSELCRIIAKWQPRQLILFESNEFALYQIDRALGTDASLKLLPVLGSVTDASLARRVIADHKVEVIFHAAAHKHVPLVEANPLEGVRNNVFGTNTIAKSAFEGGVRSFVLISTDKAVRPTNVMGATKRWAELIVRDFASHAARTGSGQKFSAVRFGNVLGSNGSVVPLFREQIGVGGPVTLTDERMTRYFMSIHEAAELIVQAGTLSEGGELFLLDMGQPVRIRDLAENMIRLAGLSVRGPDNAEGDIEIVVTGARPGEKLYEELFYDPSRAERTRHTEIMTTQLQGLPEGEIDRALGALQETMLRGDEAALRKLLFEFIST